MFFPTWLVMMLMLISFVWTILQQRRISEASSGNIRMVFLVAYIIIMLAVVLYNAVDPWLSTGFFAVAVVSVGISFHFYRQMPSRLPEEPKF